MTSKKSFWYRVARNVITPPIPGQCHYVFESGTRCGQAASRKHGDGIWCWSHRKHSESYKKCKTCGASGDDVSLIEGRCSSCVKKLIKALEDERNAIWEDFALFAAQLGLRFPDGKINVQHVFDAVRNLQARAGELTREDGIIRAGRIIKCEDDAQALAMLNIFNWRTGINYHDEGAIR